MHRALPSLAELPNDTLSDIISMLAYRQELYKLRQVSKNLDKLIEDTPDGKLAREAAQLEPGYLSQKLATGNYDFLIVCLSVVGIEVMGSLGSLMLLALVDLLTGNWENEICPEYTTTIFSTGFALTLFLAFSLPPVIEVRLDEYAGGVIAQCQDQKNIRNKIR